MTSTEPKVSVVIPTHNRKDLLIRAVESVYAQTYANIEVIVVDDGDAPRAEGFLSEYLSKDSFTYLETPKNVGAPVARNMGVAFATGKYIAFLDDDDQWVENKLSVQVQAFESASEKVGFSFTGVTVQSEEGEQVTHVYDGEKDFFELCLTNFKGFLTVTQMFRKDVLVEMGAFDESLPSHQDPELILRISQQYLGLGIDQPLTVVNGFGGRETIGTNIPKRIEGRLRLLAKHSDLYIGKEDKKAKLYFQVALWYKIVEDREKVYQYMKKTFMLHPTFSYAAHVLLAFLRKIFS